MNRPEGLLVKMHCAVITTERHIPIHCEMLYTKANPFEVVFMTDQQTRDGEKVEWHYARDLLVDCLKGQYETMYGEGDVKVFKQNNEGHKFLYTMFEEGENHIVVAFMESDMSIFVAESAKLVPIGKETLTNLDDELRDFLGDF